MLHAIKSTLFFWLLCGVAYSGIAAVGTASFAEGEKVYPVALDASATRMLWFGTVKSLKSPSVVLFAISKEPINDTGVVSSNSSIYDFTGHTEFTPKTAEQLFANGSFLSWPVPSITEFVVRREDMSITFGIDIGRSVNFFGLDFDSECPDPASSFLRVDNAEGEQQKVVLWVFPKPVKLKPVIKCETYLFAPPHDETRIIDPGLTALVGHDGTILLAGESYVAMPAVIAVPPHATLTGDRKNLFVVDKRDVDRIRQKAADDYYANREELREKFYRPVPGKVYPTKALTEADIAAMIEKALLEHIGLGGAQ